MAQKKSTTTEKDLRGKVKKLQARADRSERKADRWKAKALKAEASAKKAEQRVDKLTKRLDRPSRASTGGPAPEVRTRSLDPTPAAPAGPDDSWTVAALKDAARERGLTGFSRMSKAELLAALR